MPTNSVLYPITYSCVFNNSYTRTDCPPEVTECIPMNLDCLWVSDTEDLFNCNLCGSDEKFYIPYKQGDTLMFQTQLPDQWNADPTAPVDGWFGDTAGAAFRAQLLDADGVVVSSDVTAFASSYMVAHSPVVSDGISYQQFQIDLDAVKNTFGLTCFTIRINSFVDSGGPVEAKVVYSQPYREVEECLGEETIFTKVIKGGFPRFDCCGNWYGLPQKAGPGTFRSVGNAVFQYDNSQRYFANLQLDGSTITKDSFDDTITRTVTIDNYELQLMCLIPPYMTNIFTKWHYGARAVFIDGVKYDASGDITKETQSNTSMFIFSARFTNECDNSFTCS